MRKTLTKASRKQSLNSFVKASWTPCRSRARLAIVKRGLTYPRIASVLREEGTPVSPVAIANVVYGYTRSQYIREAIARLTGKTIEQLWPEERAS
jgi:hypothetical protein